MARWISGIILAALTVLLLVCATQTVLQFVVLGISALAAWEYNTMVGLASRISRLLTVFVTVLGCGFVLYQSHTGQALLGFYFFALVYSLCLPMFFSIDNEKRAQQSGWLALGILYISLGFGLLGLLTSLPHHVYWLFLTLACTFLGDTGAYLAGRRFGKTKLAPTLSPGKTQAGLFGGLIAGGCGGFVVFLIFQPELAIWISALLGVCVALIGGVGDLAESLLKRGCGVKDSGGLIPGHGGILDRIDGLLFSAPFVYFVARLLI